ncbi:hypothetical protein [Latilactobacillus fuchuensis]|uniref:Uncharacterized protein n=2 Tax=Latilactobacillus fuchuensis TaxID=164393 RepID=A0A2N9DWF6_9LACO|nr:hypothetical protein [Latilactobacillus fuchuensis]MCP8858057.1 hypothetical protein [Latilactobacillus fuchuensis]SPC39004.1 conserved exported hypothetical protein [Latilactobacillus fuchuensis]
MRNKRSGMALLNAVLLLSVTAGLLLIVTRSYQQQALTYTRLTRYYQAQSLANLTQSAAKKRHIKGLKTTLGTTKINWKTRQITVQLDSGYQKQFRLRGGTESK